MPAQSLDASNTLWKDLEGSLSIHCLRSSVPAEQVQNWKGIFTSRDQKREEKKTTEASNLCLFLNSTSFQITLRHCKTGSWDANNSSLVQANWCSAYWLFSLSVNSWTQWMWTNTSVPGNHASHKRKSCFDFSYSFFAWVVNQHATSNEYASVLLVKKDKVEKSLRPIYWPV